jgi:hypothetical protein
VWASNVKEREVDGFCMEVAWQWKLEWSISLRISSGFPDDLTLLSNI